VDNTVFVTLRDLESLGDVLDAVIEAGANSINGIQFDVADRTEALSEARKAAVADARAQAEELAAAAGLELGAIQNISTYGGGYSYSVQTAERRYAAEVASVLIFLTASGKRTSTWH
jgi:uncharacterized protein YggE